MSYEYLDLFYSALFSICVYSSFSDFLLLVKFTIVNIFTMSLNSLWRDAFWQQCDVLSYGCELIFRAICLLEDATCCVQPRWFMASWTSPPNHMSFPAASRAALIPEGLLPGRAPTGSFHGVESRAGALFCSEVGRRAEAEKAQKGFCSEDALRQVPPPGKTRRRRGEKTEGHCPATCSGNPGPGSRGAPTPEDLGSDGCQVLRHGKRSINVIFPLPLPLPGKYQYSVKSVFTCVILGGQAELVDSHSTVRDVGSAQEVPLRCHLSSPRPHLVPCECPQERKSPQPASLLATSVGIQ